MTNGIGDSPFDVRPVLRTVLPTLMCRMSVIFLVRWYCLACSLYFHVWWWWWWCESSRSFTGHGWYYTCRRSQEHTH